MFRYFVIATLLAVGIHSNSTLAAGPSISSRINWGTLEEALFVENQTLSGSWNERTHWNSSLCSSAFYSYDLGLNAILDDVKLGLQEDGRVTAYARFDSIFGRAKGSIQNAGTFCRELKGSVGVGIEWAEISALVSFGASGTLEELAVQVTETRLGKVELGKYFPNWFENMITGVANRALRHVWQSRLGGWLNAKITEYAKRHIPESRH
jgi:hypothetical protein